MMKNKSICGGRMLSAIAAIAVAAFLSIPLTAAAVSDADVEITWSDSQFSYYSTDGSTVTVSANGTWLSSEITVPSKVSHSSEYTVTAIGNAKNSSGQVGFQGCTGITSIYLPPTLKTISENAFSDCSSLTSLEVPASVTSIGNYAFSGCIAMKTLAIPACDIGTCVIKQCQSLETLTILYSGLKTSAAINSTAFGTGISTNIAVNDYSAFNLEAYNETNSSTGAYDSWNGLTKNYISSSYMYTHVSGFTDCSTLSETTIEVSIDDDAIYLHAATGGHEVRSIKDSTGAQPDWISYSGASLIVDPSKMTAGTTGNVVINCYDSDNLLTDSLLQLHVNATGSSSGSSDSGDSGDSGSSDSGSSDDNGDNTGLIIGGAAAAVIVIAAIGLLYFRMHR
ncbi:MAG: leucine-rich repeat domain-containing protein [Candidatus Methanomethylophilus sp.]|jgi:hypothetical protein|nr:leucine-rich repeat domain-containing protein [Methanomethylophilus sp.]MCI2075162.1 leucine-rich repeat domain-containing protein [Methanomethylophilus sp.]MCI2092504.1 leucine-rich repeat domain-containing protein [Methanomethylophilus sp.]